MFRIRKIYDDTSVANKHAIAQVQTIIRDQFPSARVDDLEKLPLQLHNPVKYQYRSILFVADDNAGRVKGFAVLLHLADIDITYLELISAAPRTTAVGNCTGDSFGREGRSRHVERRFRAGGERKSPRPMVCPISQPPDVWLRS